MSDAAATVDDGTTAQPLPYPTEGSGYVNPAPLYNAEDDVPDTPKNWIARDHVTGDYYGGSVDPELVQAWQDEADSKGTVGYVYGIQRAVITDRFGGKENVWVLANLPEMPGCLPGEVRRLTFEEVEAN